MRDELRPPTDAPDVDFYLPATPTLSGQPGPVERFIRTLLRRRDGYDAVGRRER